MNSTRLQHSPSLPSLWGLWLFLIASQLRAQPAPTALASFNAYTHAVESRLAQQHRSPETFLAAHEITQPHPADLLIEKLTEKLTPPASTPLSGAMLHHWRATAFAPGATAAGFERLLRDFSAYPQVFAPQVLHARAIEQPGGKLQATLRVRQRHVLTVVLDATYDVAFGRLDARHGYSLSRSLRIAEIEGAGTPTERALSPAEEHGFLWRLNTYWSYEERDGGLYLQIEAVSLTRAIPRGLGWAVGPYVESIPRESLEFTLRSACSALLQQAKHERKQG
jgi:hypothetical protein